MPEARLPDIAVPPILKGQNALVTGANSGIGQAVAIALGQAGAQVVVNYVTHGEAAQEVVNQIQRANTRAIALKADVSQEDQVQAWESPEAYQSLMTLISLERIGKPPDIGRMAVLLASDLFATKVPGRASL